MGWWRGRRWPTCSWGGDTDKAPRRRPCSPALEGLAEPAPLGDSGVCRTAEDRRGESGEGEGRERGRQRRGEGG